MFSIFVTISIGAIFVLIVLGFLLGLVIGMGL